MTYTQQKTDLISELTEIHNRKGYASCGIDGRCTSGKSTLAKAVAEELDAVLIHMDNFFLRPEQRTPERYAEPGGNVDYERFIEEVLTPLKKGEAFDYRPFDCRTMSLSEPVHVPSHTIVVIEGSYSMRPELREFYDLKVFLDVSSEEQMERVKKRNPDKVEAFRTKWIPYEEKYFSTYNIRNACDIIINTTGEF